MNKLRKIFKWMFLGLIIILIVTLLPTFSYRKDVNINPLPSSYKKGVYHIHSLYSDGKGDVREIAAAAAEAGVDFAILTDHGQPNRLSSMATSWQGNLLLIGGSELSLPCGHLAAVGYRLPDYIFPPETQEAVRDITSAGGICFISHPFDGRIPWTDWNVSGFTGLEVFNLYSSARKASPLALASFPTQYLFNPRYALLNLLRYPSRNLQQWDYLNRRGRFAAIFSSDAHAVLPITDNFRFYFPSYKNMFEIFQIYVKISKNLSKDPQESAGTIIEALRERRFFSVVEAIAPANGFDARLKTGGGEWVEMGGVTSAGTGRLLLNLPFEFATHVHLIKDGIDIQKLSHNQKKYLELPVTSPGVYRLEVFLAGHRFRHIPWILTNPFFIGTPAPKSEPAAIPEPHLLKSLATSADFFRVEHNPGSTGTLEHQQSEEGEDVFRFTFALTREKGKPDFWAALANRNPRDLSGSRGFVFHARSDKPRRYWLEYRTGRDDDEIRRRRSFLADTTWRAIILPFDGFLVFQGDIGEKSASVGEVQSLFFAINNANAYPGTAGTLELKRIGVF